MIIKMWIRELVTIQPDLYIKLYANKKACYVIDTITGSFSVSEWRDLNSRPLDPQSSALTRLRYTPEMSVGVSVSVGVGMQKYDLFVKLKF